MDLQPPVLSTDKRDVTELLVLLQVLEGLRGALGEALPVQVVGGYLHDESQGQTNSRLVVLEISQVVTGS